MRNPKTILITGASSGIGKSLAESYAQKDITLYLMGRNMERLNEVAKICQEKGAVTHCSAVCVTDTSPMQEKINAWDDESPIDLVIANAGISYKGAESADKAREVFRTNIDGVLNTVLPLIPKMQERGKGQIALMSSLSAFRGMPTAQSYSASKAAVKSYGEALRPRLKPSGISVSVIYPGFIRTPLTDKNTFKMPFLMEPEEAAQIIKSKLSRNKGIIAFPWPMYFMSWLLGVLPNSWMDHFLSNPPKR